MIEVWVLVIWFVGATVDHPPKVSDIYFSEEACKRAEDASWNGVNYAIMKASKATIECQQIWSRPDDGRFSKEAK